MITIVLGIFFISFASAIYGGECEQLDLSDLESLDNLVYIPVGNSSNLEGLNISLNGNGVNICLALNYKPDNFTLVFWDNSPEVIEVINEVVIYRGGGGGTRTKYIYENVTEYIEVEKIVYVNETLEVTEEPEVIEEEKVKNNSWIIWLVIIILAILFAVFLIWVFNK